MVNFFLHGTEIMIFLDPHDTRIKLVFSSLFFFFF